MLPSTQRLADLTFGPQDDSPQNRAPQTARNDPAETTSAIQNPRRGFPNIPHGTTKHGSSSSSASWKSTFRVRYGRSASYWSKIEKVQTVRPGSPPPKHNAPALCVHSDGMLLAVGMADGYVRVWERGGGVQ